MDNENSFYNEVLKQFKGIDVTHSIPEIPDNGIYDDDIDNTDPMFKLGLSYSRNPDKIV